MEKEKIVTIPGQVHDVNGLYIDLKKALFAVRNVGGDERLTYVYLEPSEEKDPTEIAMQWVGKPLPERTRTFLRRRNAEFEEAEKVVLPELGIPVEVTPDGALIEKTDEEKPGWLGKLFRKLF